MFRTAAIYSQREPTPANGKTPDRGACAELMRRSGLCTSDNTQIYEGTNQIQRMVMARNLLKG
jgi:alkylation response protein AidB-like acyl-CoA dehydrogenase